MKNDLAILLTGTTSGMVAEDNQAIISAVVTLLTWLLTKVIDRYGKEKK